MSADLATLWSIAPAIAVLGAVVLVVMVVRRIRRRRRTRLEANVVASGAFVSTESTVNELDRPGPFGRVLDVLDASVAMYMIRRGLGRSTVTRRERAQEIAEERATAALARRIGVVGVPTPGGPTRIVVAGVAPRPVVAPPPRRPGRAVGQRERLVRDTAAALAGIAVLVLVVTALSPRLEGAVLDAGGTPPAVIPPGVTADPSDLAALPSSGPDAGATPAAPIPASLQPAEATPAPTARTTPRPIVTPRVTPRPTATPRATPRPVVTPKPTAVPTPVPTPTPVPDPIAFFSCAMDGLTVTCDGSSSTNETAWSWAFGDGGTDAGSIGTHTYAAPGAYTVTLTVSNASGTNSDGKTVTVQ